MASENAHMSTPPNYSEYSQNPFLPTDEYVPNPNVSMETMLEKPIVIPRTLLFPASSCRSSTANKRPEQTNIFMIKTFSPFARSYAPILARLPDPIPREDFLSFIDNLNNAFLSHPIFQAAHVAGGALLGSQILPAQAVGGVFQVASVALSASVSVVRLRSFMKKSNAELFAPRGLVAKIMSTKKMMTTIKCTNLDSKGKLALPPLDELKDLTPQTGALVRHDGRTNTFQVPIEDPRLRRLRALEGYISPLDFETEPAQPKGMMDKYGGAPLRWLNRKQDQKLAKAASTSTAKRIEKAPEANAEVARSEKEIEEIDAKILEVRQEGQKELESASVEERRNIEARMDYETAVLEAKKLEEMDRRDENIAGIFKKGDKKLDKRSKKEEKIVNRILWVVITRLDGTVGDELLEVGSVES